MRRVAVTKVSKQKSKPTFEYPYIRLPRGYIPIVGETVTIFETDFGGQRAFLIVLNEETEGAREEHGPKDNPHDDIDWDELSEATRENGETLEPKIDLIITLLSKMKESLKGQ